VPYLEVYNRE
jgi:hypothetical protein